MRGMSLSGFSSSVTIYRLKPSQRLKPLQPSQRLKPSQHLKPLQLSQRLKPLNP